MKKIFIILALIIPVTVHSFQTDSIIPLTSGFNDRNPSLSSISTAPFSYQREMFFVFERASGDTISNIMLQKLNYDGLIGEPLAITSGTGNNINPSMSNDFISNFIFPFPKYILIVWQKFENGFWNIKAKNFKHDTGWSDEYSISSDTVDEITPRIVNKDSVTFIITYEKAGDIIHVEHNILTGAFQSEYNLTSDWNKPCHKPIPFYVDGKTTVSYYRVFYDSIFWMDRTVIVFKEKVNDIWSHAEIVSDYFASTNEGFRYYLPRQFVYTRSVFGSYKLFYRTFPGNEFTIPNQTTEKGHSSSFTETDLELNDASGLFISAHIHTDANYKHHTVMISALGPLFEKHIPIVNINFEPRVSVSERVWSTEITNCYKNYFVFNDHNPNGTDPYESRIFGYIFKNCLTDIVQTNSNIPEAFELHQNFPNPFNPATTLSFDIPQTALVELTVYDALGRVVATLVNENLTAGVYQYQFTTDNYQLPSGIYFYRLSAGEFSKTKKLMLLK